MFPTTPDDPRSVGPHVLLARLGAGGMGKVYLARTPGGDLAALKLVRDHLAHDTEFRARFSREVRAAARVHGPFTPAVVDSDTEADVPWLATEYVPGPTLKEAVLAHGPLPADSLPVLLLGLARALEAVHGAGLMHRDLKPSNVLLSPRGPQVIDFGLARAVEGTVLTRTGQTFGTPAYTSPEQITGHDVSPASDVFSLAGTVLFAASGEPPFGAGKPRDSLRRIISDAPNLAAVPEGPLRDLLARCLAKAPAERPDVAGLIAELADVPLPETEHEWLPAPVTEQVRRSREQGKETGPKGPAPEVGAAGAAPGEKPGRYGRGRWRRPALVAGAAAAALLLLGGGGYALTAWGGPGPDGSANTDGPAADGEPDEGSGGGPSEREGPPESAFAPALNDPDLWLADQITFSPDGERAYVFGTLNFSVWDLSAAEMVGQLNPSPGDASVTPDGLIFTTRDDRIEIRDDDGDTLLSTLTRDDAAFSYQTSPALSRDGDQAVTVGSNWTEGEEHDRTLQFWDLETGEVVRELPLEGDLAGESYLHLEYTADGDYLVARVDGTELRTVLGISVWEVGTGTLVHHFESTGNMQFGLHPTDPSVMAMLDDDRVRLIDLRTGGEIGVMSAIAEDHARVNSLAFSPDGAKLYAGVHEGSDTESPFGSVWDTGTGEALHEGDVLLPGPLAVHPDGERVAAVDTGNRRVLVLDSDDFNIIDEMS